MPVAAATPGGARASTSPTVPAVANSLLAPARQISLTLLVLRIVLLFGVDGSRFRENGPAPGMRSEVLSGLDQAATRNLPNRKAVVLEEIWAALSYPS